jgi:hypothetical protein
MRDDSPVPRLESLQVFHVEHFVKFARLTGMLVSP